MSAAPTLTQGVPGNSQDTIQPVATPFNTSRPAVNKPATKPAARIALVPPVRPLSTARRSLPLKIQTTSKPNGIDPATYDRTNTSNIFQNSLISVLQTF